MKLTSLTKLTPQPNTHNPKVTKKVLIRNGQIPHLTNFTQAVFPPGEVAAEHSHSDMFEVFFAKRGNGIIKINGKKYPLETGTCATVEPGELHEVSNPSNKNLIVIYMGIEV